MANVHDFKQAPLLLIAFKDGFTEPDYAAPLGGPFDVTNPLQAALLRAQALGMGVIVQFAVVPLSDIWGDEPSQEIKDGDKTGKTG